MSGQPHRQHVIVQAGGKGTRLEQYSWNKPKCLAPVDGKPLLYHAFDAFPGAKFYIICDYKKEIVTRFLEVFPPEADYEVVEVSGSSGTVAGLPEAVARIPADAPVTITWCDLKYTAPPQVPATDRVVVGTTHAFPCRWSVLPDGTLAEKRSDTHGIIGFFVFPRSDALADLPRSGEFVRWLAESGLPTLAADIAVVKEIGTIDALLDQWAVSGHARFFNHVEIGEAQVVKRTKLPQYEALLAGEVAWYRRAAELGFRAMPQLLAESPLTLSRIHGRHPFDFEESARGRETVLRSIIGRLDALHALDRGPASAAVAREVYATKTMQRLENIARLLPDIVGIDSFRVNGTLCRNILHSSHAAHFAAAVEAVLPDEFRFVHGDPTFSNTLITPDGEAWFIDPRGKFGSSWFLGDANYDWAKLYYSVEGEYDNFNRRRFLLEMDGRNIVVQIRPGGWAHLRGLLREARVRDWTKIRILHGLIWLSLSGYVSDDYDSILASYFMGLLMLEEALA